MASRAPARPSRTSPTTEPEPQLPKVAAASIRLLRERPWLVASAFVMAIWTFRLFAVYYSGPHIYNSDQVGAANVVAEWQRGFHQGAVVSPDNFFLKFPLLLLVDNLPLGPLEQLLVAAWLLLAATVVPMLWSSELCFERLAVRLPVADHRPIRHAVWIVALGLAALPTSSFFWLGFLDSRNIEIGISLWLLGELYLFITDEPGARRRTVWRALAVVAAPLVFADDPLTLYVIGVPAVVVCLTQLLRSASVRPRVSRARVLAVVAAFAWAVVASKAVVRLLELLLPMHVQSAPTTIVSATQFLQNLAYTVGTGGEMFGLQPWSASLTSLSLWTTLLSGLLLFSASAGVVLAWRRGGRDFYGSSLAAVFLALVGLFLLTTVGVGGDYRFLLLGAVLLPLGAGLAALLVGPRTAIGLRALVCAILLLVLGSDIANLATQFRVPNQGQLTTVARLKALHLRKGYADYWDAGLDNFLSQYSLDLVNVQCTNGADPRYYNWWSDRGLLTMKARSTSFLR